MLNFFTDILLNANSSFVLENYKIILYIFNIFIFKCKINGYLTTVFFSAGLYLNPVPIGTGLKIIYNFLRDGPV